MPKFLDGLSDVICENYLMYVLSRLGDFRGSDTGFTTEQNVRRTIDELLKQEILVETNMSEVALRFGIKPDNRSRQKLYLLGPSLD